MSQTPYRREQGDFELRILPDGRLVMIAPDETLMEIAKAFEPCHCETRRAAALRAEGDEAISTLGMGDCFASLAMTHESSESTNEGQQHPENRNGEAPNPDSQ